MNSSFTLIFQGENYPCKVDSCILIKEIQGTREQGDIYSTNDSLDIM